MRSVYLFSNFDKELGFTDEIAENLKMDLIDKEILVFIASSPTGHDKSDYYFNINKRWFELIDIKFKYNYLIDNRIKKNIADDFIRHSSCVFLMGGTTREQMAYIEENEFIEILQEHKGIVVGVSAGAINLAKRAFSFRGSKDQETKIYNGIGLTNKTVHPHFRIDDVEIINEIKKFSNNFAIYGLCDYSAIIEKENETRIVGEVYKIENNIVNKMN